MPTPLYTRMSHPDNLHAAWLETRKGGKSAGLDGMTVEQFEFHQERELTRLRRELVEGGYRPWPARRVSLPKADGSTRRIGVQAVRDRVAQRALLRLIQPRIEPRLEDCSYAFRPGRSVDQALARLSGWREAGFHWVARSDIALCFDSLDRERLLEMLAEVLPEPDVLTLVGHWLTAGVVDETGWQEPGQGVSQGDVLSPMLCNLYLDAFDEALHRHEHPLIRYADDFVLLGRSMQTARLGLERAEAALEQIGLLLNRRKSFVTSFTSGFEYLGAGIAGSLILPLHRVERPQGPPRFTFGYEAPRRREPSHTPALPPLVTSERALRDQMVALLRAQRAGRRLTSMQEAMLQAWQEAGYLSATKPPPEPDGWQSVYLI